VTLAPEPKMPTSSGHSGRVTRASGIPVPPLSAYAQAGPTRAGTTPVTEMAGPSATQESQPRQLPPLAGPATAPLSTQVVADADPLVQGPFTSTLPFSTPTLPLPTSGLLPEHPVSQPASLDAVVDALLAEVSDLRDEHRRLRLEIQHLQEENSHARDTEARVRGELEAVKTRVAELSQNFTPTPHSNYRPGVRSHRTPSRGDPPNSHSRRSGHPTPGDSASSDDEAEQQSSRMIRQLPKGNRISGLVPLTNFRPEFQALVSYRRYRLADTDPIVDAEVTDCLHSYLKRMKQHLDYQFSGSPAIKVLDFLRSFKIAADVSRLSEGAAALVLPNFLSGRAKTGVVTHLKQIPESIPEYPAAVQWLLQSYATEAVITQACDRVNQAKQHPNEDEREFADRLGSYAADAGSVFPERQLIAAYLSGLSAYVSATLRGRINPRMTFPEVQAIAEEIGIAAKALAASRPPPRAPAPGLLPIRPRSVAAMAEDQSTITFADAYHSARSGFELAQVNPVAAPVEYYCPEQGISHQDTASELSAPSSCPTRGWTSIGGDRIVEANLVDREPRCYLCMGLGHFVLACPFLGRDARARALQHREKVFRKEPFPLPRRYTHGEDLIRGPASMPPSRTSGSPRPTVPIRSAEAAATETIPQELSLEQPHHPAENE
jgi:hypothetical protein